MNAKDYVETVYGTKNLARTLELNDVDSLFTLMEDYADAELKLKNLPIHHVSGSLIIGIDICNKGGTGTACSKCGDVRNCINDR